MKFGRSSTPSNSFQLVVEEEGQFAMMTGISFVMLLQARRVN
jgi:mannose/fructose-specific phosphotransferase system component IIA